MFPHAGQESGLIEGVSKFKSAKDESKLGLQAKMKSIQEESALRTERNKMERDRNEQIQREAQNTCASKVATVKSTNDDRTLELMFTDGQDINRVANLSRYSFPDGASVTIERTGKEWVCVGPATFGATQPDFTTPDDNAGP